MTAPARNAPTMKCRPDQSAPKAHSASQISATYQRSRSGSRCISRRKPIADDGEGDQEAGLLADALPVHQDQRQHAPDGDVVQAGVAQDALADGLAQDLQLFHEQDQDGQRGDRAGHADAEHELPGHAPSGRSSRRRPAGPRPRRSRRAAATPSARPAVIAALAAVLPGLPQVEFDAGDHHEAASPPTRRCRSATGPPPG